MKLNLGCGYNHIEGYVNVDHDASSNPEVVANLEERLPFEDSSVKEIVLNHVLEHLGHTTSTFLSIIKELYRVSANEGEIKIAVPHYLHENFNHDPTHCRKITPVTIDMFNQARNKRTIEEHGQETTLGYQCGVDIEVVNVAYDCSEDISHLSFQEISDMAYKYPNFCSQIRIHAIVHKPARYKS